ncbi:SDR family oxidoreductase [Actinocorallia sp. API 0066]|uniref:SDR family oxidoreductase n=1 Tax=Actinocorallia sp. API 0066 TaxID=2896846 RepID=UPI0027DF5FA3|nr:SDR family oxidoreductase [Actinocorallia sp. API 0066]
MTGGGGGLGRAVAVRVAREGARLVLVDLGVDGLGETADVVAGAVRGTDVVQIVADVKREADVARVVAETVRTFGRIDGFFNNAEVAGERRRTEDYGPVEFDRVVAVNLRGAFLGLKYVLGQMREQGHGTVVNTAMVDGSGNRAAYAASKEGVIGLTRNAGLEYGRHGITVKAIAVGSVLTPPLEEYLGGLPEGREAAEERVAAEHPMGRLGTQEEVADLVAFLLSDEASFINATTVTIDGGRRVDP